MKNRSSLLVVAPNMPMHPTVQRSLSSSGIRAAGDGQRYTDMLNELRPLTFCRDDAMYGIRVCIWSDSVPADPNDAGNVS